MNPHPTLTRWWSRWGELTDIQRIELARATVELPWMWRRLQRQGLKAVYESIRQRRDSSRETALPHDQVRLLAEAVNMAATHSPFHVTCLSRSLVLLQALARHSTLAELQVGVRMAEGRLDAHAWVTHEGEPVNDRPDIGEIYASFDDWNLDLIFS